MNLENPFFPLTFFPARLNRRVKVRPMGKGSAAAGGMNPETGEAFLPVEKTAYFRNVRRHEAMHGIFSTKQDFDPTALGQGFEDLRIHVLGQASINELARKDELVSALTDLRYIARNIDKLSAMAASNPAGLRCNVIPLVRSLAMLHFPYKSSKGNAAAKQDRIKRLADSCVTAFESALNRKGLAAAVTAACNAVLDGDRKEDAKKALRPFLTIPKAKQQPKPEQPKQPKPKLGNHSDGKQDSDVMAPPPVGEEEEEEQQPEEQEEPEQEEQQPKESDEEPEQDNEEQDNEDGKQEGKDEDASGSKESDEDGEESEDEESSGSGSEKESEDEDEESNGSGSDSDEDEDGEESEDANGSGSDSEDGEDEEPESNDSDSSNMDASGSGSEESEEEDGEDGKSSGSAGSGDSEDGEESEEEAEDEEFEDVKAEEPSLGEAKEMTVGGIQAGAVKDGTDGLTEETLALLPQELLDQLSASVLSSRAGSSNGLPKMTIERLPFSLTKKITEGKSAKPSMSGAKIRAKRLAGAIGPNPGRLFERRGKKEGGTVLIDASGSMRFTSEQLAQLAERLPIGQIAYYSGEDNTGKLVIYAYNRRCYVHKNKHERLPFRIGGNEIDLPAIQWLMKQPGPRWLITDMGYCGMRGGHLVDKAATLLTLRGYDRKLFKVLPTFLSLELALGMKTPEDVKRLPAMDQSYEEAFSKRLAEQLKKCRVCGGYCSAFAYSADYGPCGACDSTGKAKEGIF